MYMVDVVGCVMLLTLSLIITGEAEVSPSLAGSHAAIRPPSILSQSQDTRTQRSHSRGIHTRCIT